MTLDGDYGLLWTDFLEYGFGSYEEGPGNRFAFLRTSSMKVSLGEWLGLIDDVDF